MPLTKRKDGECFEVPIGEIYKLACCDCGLVHRVAFVIADSKLFMAAERDNRSTGQTRRFMNAKTRKALLESVAHWDRIAHGIDDSIWSDSCPLCHRFCNDCRRCVAQCQSTEPGAPSPWERCRDNASEAWLLVDGGATGRMLWRKKQSPQFWDAVEDKIEYLISLCDADDKKLFDLGD